MANFSFTFEPVRIDVGGNAWVDPASSLPNPYGGSPISIPSRQNVRSGLPHRYARFVLGDEVRVSLTPNSFFFPAPPDSSLGGNLFQAWFAEVPRGACVWNSVPGQSATQWFTPQFVGAYCAVFWRPSGGGIVWHFMVE